MEKISEVYNNNEVQNIKTLLNYMIIKIIKKQ